MLSKSQVSSSENDRSFVRRVPKQRQRFTPWLEQQIESGDIDGLEWIDKDIGIFKVPWVRVDKPEFELETHAELFKRWASHTGKYRPGDQPDPSTWKVRFRCALRKTQEIVEIKHLGNLEGTRAYRVFKFEPKLKGKDRNLCQICVQNILLRVFFSLFYFPCNVFVLIAGLFDFISPELVQTFLSYTKPAVTCHHVLLKRKDLLSVKRPASYVDLCETHLQVN